MDISGKLYPACRVPGGKFDVRNSRVGWVVGIDSVTQYSTHLFVRSYIAKRLSIGQRSSTGDFKLSYGQNKAPLKTNHMVPNCSTTGRVYSAAKSRAGLLGVVNLIERRIIRSLDKHISEYGAAHAHDDDRQKSVAGDAQG